MCNFSHFNNSKDQYYFIIRMNVEKKTIIFSVQKDGDASSHLNLIPQLFIFEVLTPLFGLPQILRSNFHPTGFCLTWTLLWLIHGIGGSETMYLFSDNPWIAADLRETSNMGRQCFSSTNTHPNECPSVTHISFLIQILIYIFGLFNYYIIRIVVL